MKASAPKLDQCCPDTLSSERDKKKKKKLQKLITFAKENIKYLFKENEKLDFAVLNMRNVPRKASQTSAITLYGDFCKLIFTHDIKTITVTLFSG